MGYSLPTFNLMCNIWHDPANCYTDPPSLTVACNLTYGRIVSSTQGGLLFPFPPVMSLLLPKLTDIRSQLCGVADNLEVPAGSGRFYSTIGVDDVGKGFQNEHRCAIISGNNSGGTHLWPSPIP